MMMNEFTERTGIEPTAEEYGMIEEMYYEFDGDKNAFCKTFVEKNLMLEVQREIVKAVREKVEDLNKDIIFVNKALHDAKCRIAKLEADLEREQEWKPYEYRENAKQADYEKLANAGARELTDAEAIELLADWWGFQPDKIKIIRTVNKIEINRHNRCRKCGEYDRDPLYEATDWNYIRFDCGMMTYEMINGDLSFFVH